MKSAPALRLLYACLTPLKRVLPIRIESCNKFLKTIPFNLNKEMLNCANVLARMRRALGVSDSEHLMLLLLVDEGNTARGAFPRGKGDMPPEVRTLDLSGLHCLFNCLLRFIILL